MQQPEDPNTPRGTIGRCEICGLVDHNLIAGLCPLCDEKSITIDKSTEVIELLGATKGSA